MTTVEGAGLAIADWPSTFRSQATRRSSSLAPSTVVTSDSRSVCFTSSLNPSARVAAWAVCSVYSSGRILPNNELSVCIAIITMEYQIIKLPTMFINWTNCAILDGKRRFCVFEPPKDQRTMIILGSLESATSFSVNWTLSLDVTAEALRANVGTKLAISLQRWPIDPKF